MKDTRDLLKIIARELAAVENDLSPLRARLRALEIRQEKLRAAQTVFLEFQEKENGHFLEPLSTRAAALNGGRYFRSEGDTVNQVRILYDKPEGVRNVEAARMLKMNPKNSRRNFERLITQGLAARMGDVYRLNAQGRKEWENSPLFRTQGANVLAIGTSSADKRRPTYGEAGHQPVTLVTQQLLDASAARTLSLEPYRQ